jgi:hypothetical protein
MSARDASGSRPTFNPKLKPKHDASPLPGCYGTTGRINADG